MTPSPRPPLALQCPHCQGKFAVPAESTARRFRCPHCQRPVAVPAAAPPDAVREASAPISPPVIEPAPPRREPRSSGPSVRSARNQAGPAAPNAQGTAATNDVVTAPRNANDELNPASEVTAQAAREAAEREAAEQLARRERARHLLPPRFTARPPGVAVATTPGSAVLIPSADGGFTTVAADLVRVSHRGREVTLRKTQPSERRPWASALIVLACAAVLIATLLWLLGAKP